MVLIYRAADKKGSAVNRAFPELTTDAADFTPEFQASVP